MFVSLYFTDKCNVFLSGLMSCSISLSSHASLSCQTLCSNNAKTSNKKFCSWLLFKFHFSLVMSIYCTAIFVVISNYGVFMTLFCLTLPLCHMLNYYYYYNNLCISGHHRCSKTVYENKFIIQFYLNPGSLNEWFLKFKHLLISQMINLNKLINTFPFFPDLFHFHCLVRLWSRVLR